MDDHRVVRPVMRSEARHWLDGIDHQLLELQRALSPETGVAIMTLSQFREGIDKLQHSLENTFKMVERHT